MFYHKGELHPLLSDHPDIKKAWKAWDEIIVLWEKVAEGYTLQSQDISERNSGKDEGDGQSETDFLSVKDSTDTFATELQKTKEVKRHDDAR